MNKNFDNTATFRSLETGLVFQVMQAGFDTRYTYIAKLQSWVLELPGMYLCTILQKELYMNAPPFSFNPLFCFLQA